MTLPVVTFGPMTPETLTLVAGHLFFSSMLWFKTPLLLSKSLQFGYTSQYLCPASFSTSCVSSLRELEMSMLRFSLPLVSPHSDGRELLLDYNVLDIWAHLRKLSRWLGVDGMYPFRDHRPISNLVSIHRIRDPKYRHAIVPQVALVSRQQAEYYRSRTGCAFHPAW